MDTITDTDTNFLTKMQKRAISIKFGIIPPITKHLCVIFTADSKFFVLFQMIEITFIIRLCYSIITWGVSPSLVQFSICAEATVRRLKILIISWNNHKDLKRILCPLLQYVIQRTLHPGTRHGVDTIHPSPCLPLLSQTKLR